MGRGGLGLSMVTALSLGCTYIDYQNVIEFCKKNPLIYRCQEKKKLITSRFINFLSQQSLGLHFLHFFPVKQFIFFLSFQC
jgi:hypothetical protein